MAQCSPCYTQILNDNPELKAQVEDLSEGITKYLEGGGITFLTGKRDALVQHQTKLLKQISESLGIQTRALSLYDIVKDIYDNLTVPCAELTALKDFIEPNYTPGTIPIPGVNLKSVTDFLILLSGAAFFEKDGELIPVIDENDNLNQDYVDILLEKNILEYTNADRLLLEYYAVGQIIDFLNLFITPFEDILLQASNFVCE